MILYPCTEYPKEICWLISKVCHGHGHVCCRVASSHTSICLCVARLGSSCMTGLWAMLPWIPHPMMGSSCLLSLSISTCAYIIIAQLVLHCGWNYASHYSSYLLLIALFFNFSSWWFSLLSSWFPLFLPSINFPSSLLFPFPLFKFT